MLLHLSFRDNLTSPLIPRQPADSVGDISDIDYNSSTYENLPDRVSFAPSIEQCFWAIYPNISHLFEEEKYPHMDFYLYRGIPNSRTKYIDNKEVLANVHDAHVTGEICVTTPIKIERIKHVRIFNCTGNKEIKYRMFNDPKNPLIFLSHEIEYEYIE